VRLAITSTVVAPITHRGCFGVLSTLGTDPSTELFFLIFFIPEGLGLYDLTNLALSTDVQLGSYIFSVLTRLHSIQAFHRFISSLCLIVVLLFTSSVTGTRINMGGGSSRFEETDWESATGKLTSSDETIDGAPPTPKYRVYSINKTAGVINQREYDVTDDESNLLYSTRGIEGRLAWFDVMGPQMDQYLLRVQVDLSRRYWVIYRFGVPSYPGQFPDTMATNLLRQSRGESQPCLYRKACITVTWSRYHAIVNLYGPPPENLIEQQGMKLATTKTSDSAAADSDGKEKQNDGDDEHANDKNNDDDTPAWATMVLGPDFGRNIKPKQGASQSPTKNESNKETLATETVQGSTTENQKQPPVEAEKLSPSDEPQGTTVMAEKSTDDEAHDVKCDGTVEETKNETEEIANETQSKSKDAIQAKIDSGDAPLRDFSNPIEEIPEHLRNPNLGPKIHHSKSHDQIKKFSKWVKENTSDIPPDPLEGYLELDKPILKCEEINSFLGQHQTMLVGDKEAKRLEQEELRTAAEIGADAHNPNANQKPGLVTSEGEATSPPPAAAGAEGGSMTIPSKKKDAKSFSKVRKFGKWLKKVGEAGTEWATSPPGSVPSRAADSNKSTTKEKDSKQTDIDGAAHNEANGDEKEDSDIDNSDQIRPTSSQISLDDQSTSSSKSGKHEVLEPLVGFWNWDNTMRVHKMKMHVAEGSDLALHVVLAIVTNQLRYERNVVVTTV
jgi:hypothetical protein